MKWSKYFKTEQEVKSGCIFLVNPKHPHNVGMVKRLAACHGFPQVWCTGKRIIEAVDALDRFPREERLKGYEQVDLVWSETFPSLPGHLTPVAVEFRKESEDCFLFDHPKDAVYIFGAEDGILGRPILVEAHRFLKIDTHECRFLKIDTHECLNLVTAVATVMYDKRIKQAIL